MFSDKLGKCTLRSTAVISDKQFPRSNRSLEHESDLSMTSPISAGYNYSQTDNPSKLTESRAKSPVGKYQDYDERLKTFDTWESKEVSKEALAGAGFYYKQHSDVVQCPVCLIEGYQWVSGDDPMQDHRTWSPNCPFVMSSVQHDNHTPPTHDTCGLYGIQILPHSVPEDEHQLKLEQLGIKKTKGPAHPEKFSVESRLATFGAWPKSMRQTPKQLAEAGFFYVGVGDQTLCFHCGGGLKDWEENDDPWEEHATWFPRCQYLFLRKGNDYIEEVRQKKDSKHNIPKIETKEESTTGESPLEEKADDESSASSDSESKTLCKICYKNEVGVVFLPCGHIVSCVDCAGALKTCPMCRKPLEATVRAFLS